MHIDWKNKETTYCFRFGTAYNNTQPNKGMNGVLHPAITACHQHATLFGVLY